MKDKAIDTPWGPAQTVIKVARGITMYSTASHGGFHLSPSRNAKIPYEAKENTWCQQGLNGWYEEDCDAEIVLKTFPEYFIGRSD